MRNGSCSKCGHGPVHMARNGLKLGEQPWPVLMPHMEANARGVRVGHNAEIWQFVCVACGYLELHVLDAAALAFIRQRWPVVPAKPVGQT